MLFQKVVSTTPRQITVAPYMYVVLGRQVVHRVNKSNHRCNHVPYPHDLPLFDKFMMSRSVRSYAVLSKRRRQMK